MKTPLALSMIFMAATCHADPYYTSGVNYTLNGPITEQPMPFAPGNAIVCGLKSAESYLSLRSGPSSSASEIIKLNSFTIVNKTGTVSDDRKWVQTDSFLVAADADGRQWPTWGFEPIAIPGWVYVDYLCDFIDHPAN